MIIHYIRYNCGEYYYAHHKGYSRKKQIEIGDDLSSPQIEIGDNPHSPQIEIGYGNIDWNKVVCMSLSTKIIPPLSSK